MDIRSSSLSLSLAHPTPTTTPSLCWRRLAQVYHQPLPVDGLLPFPPSSVRLAEKASQEEISKPITRGASTSAAGAPQSECWWEQPGLHNNRPGGVCQQRAASPKPDLLLILRYDKFQWYSKMFPQVFFLGRECCANEPRSSTHYETHLK